MTRGKYLDCSNDCAGQDVIDGFKDDIFDDVAWIL